MTPPSLSLAGNAVRLTGACDKAFSAALRMRSRSIEAMSTTTLGETGVPAADGALADGAASALAFGFDLASGFSVLGLAPSAFGAATVTDLFSTFRNWVRRPSDEALNTALCPVTLALICARPLYICTTREPVEVPRLSSSCPSPTMPKRTILEQSRQGTPSASAMRASMVTTPSFWASSVSVSLAGLPQDLDW